MANLYSCMLIKDEFLYFPQMGMYFKLSVVKRVSGDNQKIFNDKIDIINNGLKVIDGSNKWLATAFLTPKQITDLSEDWVGIISPKSYLMVANPGFTGNIMPSYGSWVPAQLVWRSNRDVLLAQYGDSAEDTANWMGHRFEVVSHDFVKKATTPLGSLASIGTAIPPAIGGTTTPPSNGGAPGNIVIPSSIRIDLHIYTHNGDAEG